jgi:hypothetical protein
MIDKYSAHRFGCSTKEPTLRIECRSAIPSSRREAQVGFMNQRRRVERMAWLFVGEFGRSEIPELFVNIRKEVGGVHDALGNKTLVSGRDTD